MSSDVISSPRVGSTAAVIPPEHKPGLIRQAWSRVELLTILLALVVVWAIVTAVFSIPTYILPSPFTVVMKFFAEPGIFVGAWLATAFAAAVGFLIALTIGVGFGILIANSPLLERFVYPYLNVIRVTPLIAVAPILLIWLGVGFAPVIVVSALISFFPIVVTTVLGLKSVEPDLLNLMRTLNASERDVLRKIKIPNAMPYVFAALRISAPLAVIGAMVGEFMGASQGIGYMLIQARGRLDMAMVFVLVVASASLGIASFAAVVAIERRVIGWHASVGH